MTSDTRLRLRRPTPWIIAALIIVIGGGVLWYTLGDRARSRVEYETAPVTRGPVRSRVSATGTLVAVTRIEVGSEVSGIISRLYVDFNSAVEKGQPLAQIDPSTFQTQVDQQVASVSNATAQYHNQIANHANAMASIRSADAALEGALARCDTGEAGVANAVAGVASAQASVRKAQADLAQALTQYNRYRTLLQKDLVAQSERDIAYTQYLNAKATLAQVSSSVDAARAQQRSAEASLRAAKADVDAARMRRASAVAQSEAAAAQVRAAQAVVSQARANLAQARVNLGRTTIRSPIRGIVLDRKITIGQTVAASFQAPDLFTLAENLDQMQVETSVDEADIGRVHKGARATFTVDAYPSTRFKGRVTEVRQSPVTVANVVTYTVVLTTSNEDHRLKPGMTATVSIDDESRETALLLPNAALRFRPPSKDGKDTRGAASGTPQPTPSAADSRDRGAETVPKTQRVYTLDPSDRQKLVAHEVVLGISDGLVTEIVKSDLKEGDGVVVGSSADANGTGSSTRRGSGPGGRPRFF